MTINLTENARTILERRYLLRDENKQLAEDPEGLFRRVADYVSKGDAVFLGEPEAKKYADEYYKMLSSTKFLANTPCLMNAGAKSNMLFACFVLPMDDAISEMEVVDDGECKFFAYGKNEKSGILDTALATTLVQKSGGGTGFCYSDLRPRGDFIRSAGGTGRTSGPISFLRMMNAVTESIQQGASRRGANMATFSSEHPSLMDFVTCKDDHVSITNYNISVFASDEFMTRCMHSPDMPWMGVNPRTGKTMYIIREFPADKTQEVKKIANIADDEHGLLNYPVDGEVTTALDNIGVQFWTYGEIFDKIIDGAWRTGDPGLIFADRINGQHPLSHLGPIKATNPCGEQPLLPWEACVLGSIDVSKYVCESKVEGFTVDWNELGTDVMLAIRFLDNCVEINNYPLPQIKRVTQANRKVGLGIMGFADLLFKLGVRYGSEESLVVANQVMGFINEQSIRASEALSDERGCFKNWEGSTWSKDGRRMRNGCVTTIAPTGTIARIAGCSSGIEPVFSLAYTSNVMSGTKLVDTNSVFEAALDKWLSNGYTKPSDMVSMTADAVKQRVLNEAMEHGTIRHLDWLPKEIRDVFVTARDVTTEEHIKMQAAFQKHVDSSISKTINMPESVTKGDVRRAYIMAYELGCKGITVYRDNCRSTQVLNLSKKSEAPKPTQIVEAPDVLSAVCIKVHTPWGTLHTQIGIQMPEQKELELFAELGRGGDMVKADIEATCRLASTLLRAGVPLEKVWYQLQGIGSRLASIPTKNGRITSIPDALSIAIKKYMLAKKKYGVVDVLLGKVAMDDIDPREDEVDHNGVGAAFAMKCPSCSNSTLVHSTGCVECLTPNCGYSMC